ncbi:MAG: relaxase domain-containing protein, partial [Ekhidna sp.]|nr:relaxase domain-containing protein [Ekhidna sp.]
MVADRHAILLLIGSMIAGIILLTSPAPIQVEIESHQVMLRLNTFKTAKSVIEYHKIGLEHEGNYFNEAHTVRAIWEGDLSRRLGLGVVDQDNFSAIFSNENPDDRTQNLTPVTKTERRAGYELLISPPKDLSLLIAFSEEDGEKLLKASKDANRATMLEFQRLAQHQNNRDGLRKYVNDVEIAFCTYSHEESRGNLITRKDGSEVIAGSPLTHHHNLIPNVVWSKEQQRFRALEVGNVSMPYLQAYYHKTLINQVQSLGYSVTREGNFWSIDGISREQVERFSPRTKQVADIAKEKGITDPKEIAKIAARYREKKSAAVPKDQLYEIWREQLSDKEYLDLQNLKNHPKSTTKHVTVKEAIDRSLEYCLERNATAEKHKVLEYAMKIGFPSSFTPDEVKNELQSRKDIYYAQKDGKEILTTQKAHLLEEKLLQKVVAGKGTQCPLNKDFVPKEPFINSDQKSAIKGILSSKSAINCLIGKAGSGKTTVLKSIESGIRKKSKNVVAVAPSSAAVDVLRKEGFENAQTVAYLLSNTPKQKQQLQNGCLIVDEASFLPTQTLSDLVSLTKQYRCKTVLVGDPKQLNAPSAGDAMRLLTEKADIPTFSLNKILRQKDRLHAQSVTKASRGDISGSFRDLEKLNSIVEIPDKNTRFKHIADNFIASIKAKRSAIIVSPTNKERLDLTQTVYDQMKAHGLVSGAVKTFEQLKALNLTNAERKDLQTYKPNQVVRFIQKHVS